MTLAERIDQTVRDFDLYSYRDANLSVEHFENCLKKYPEAIITLLLDMVDCMREENNEG